MLGIHHLKRPCMAKHMARTLQPFQTTIRQGSCCSKKQEEKPAVTSTKFWSDPITWQRTRVNTLRYIKQMSVIKCTRNLIIFCIL